LLLLTWGAGRATSAQRLSLRSGDYVILQGTTLQCLVFGPVAKIVGRTGTFCFEGKPRRHRQGTYWAWQSTTSLSFADGEDAQFDAITSATHIRRTVLLSLNGSFRVVGTNLGCFFQVSRKVDPGHKVVVCSEVDAVGPLPGKVGFVLSERLVASVTFGSDRKLKTINYSQRQPG
jgi:hypothetical protein